MDQLAAPETQRAPPTPESPGDADPAGLYERAKRRQARQKKREDRLDSSCTFSPKVTSRARRASLDAQDSRFDKLYNGARKRKEEREERRLKEAQTPPKGCTFSPKVKGSRARGPASPEATFQKLYDEADRRQSRRLAAENPAPSFRPQLVAKDPRRAKRHPSPFHERMHLASDVHQQRRAALEEKKKALELEGCTFKPRLNSKTRSVSAPRAGRTAAERNEAFLKRKELRMKQRQQQLEEERRKNETWKPKINNGLPEVQSRLEAAVTQRQQRSGHDGDVFERLSQTGTVQDRMLSREKALRELSADNTFVPNLNKQSRRIAEKSRSRSAPRLGGKENSLWKRLHEESEKLEQKREKEKEKITQLELEQCSFKPQVGKTHDEASEETWERLLGDRASVLVLRDEVKAVQELDGCTFKPELPTQPRALRSKRNSETNVYQRLQAETEKAARQQELRQEMKDMLELEDCTFRPTLVAEQPTSLSNSHRDEHQSVYDRLLDEAQKRKHRQERLKESVESQEYGDCTFTPSVLGLDALASSEVARRRSTESSVERIKRLASPSLRGVTNKREEVEKKWARDSEIRRSTPSRRINRSASRERDRGRSSSRGGTPSSDRPTQGRRSRRDSLSRERRDKQGRPRQGTQTTPEAASTTAENQPRKVRGEEDFAEFEATILKKLEAL